MDRRRFLIGSASTLILTPLSGGLAAAGSRRLEKIGLQLSTLTPLMVADFEGTLETVAAIGYDQVEFSALGLLGRETGMIRDLLGELGLEAPQGRISPSLPPEFFALGRAEQRVIFAERSHPDRLLENVEHAMNDAKRLGQTALILPALSAAHYRTLEEVERTIHLFERAGALCAGEGLQFGYHNHDWELTPIDGVVPYDLLIRSTDPEQVTFQLDAYWIRKGGGDLSDYLQRFPGRFSSCHMKDIDDAGDFADVGDGNIDFPRFTREAMEAGARYFFVERDNPPDPLSSAKRSYEYLRQMTF